MHKRVIAAASLVLALTGLAACNSGGGTENSAGRSSGGSVACPDGKLRFGVEPFEDPAKLTPAYQTLAKALEKKIGCTVQLQIVQSYSAEVLAMQNGKLELGQFGPLGFVFASKRAGAEALVSFGDDKGQLSSYKAGIWVPADSPVKTIADLKGKTLALSEPGSTSGDALPRYAMSKAGLTKNDVKQQYAGGHPQALLALANGKVDAAEINTQQLATATGEGKFDESQFRRIWESDPIPNDPIAIAGKLDPKLKDAIRKALVELEPADVKAAGAFLDAGGTLVEVDKKTYQPLFDLAATLGLTEKDV